MTQIRFAAPIETVGRQMRIGKPQGRRQAEVAAADDSDVELALSKNPVSKHSCVQAI